MIRSITLFFICMMITVGCSSSKKKVNNDFSKLEYTAISRGTHLKIVIEDSKFLVTFKLGDESSEKQVKEKGWNDISNEVKQIHLEELQYLKAPTNKRFHDGAAIANLIVVKNGQRFETQSFDHGFPPSEIKKLINLIVNIANE